jgi:hypothetical protein
LVWCPRSERSLARVGPASIRFRESPIVLDDAAAPVAYSHVKTDRLDLESARYAATESW